MLDAQTVSNQIGLALERGRHALLRTQGPEGAWDERSDVGPMSTAMVAIALRWLGALPESDLAGVMRWLRSQQGADGSFRARPFATSGDVATTALCGAALGLDSSEESRAAARRAHAFVDAHGGDDEVLARVGSGDTSAFFCAMAGALDPRRLPDPHLSWALVPGLVQRASERVHFGVVMGALQMSLLSRRLRGDYGADGTRRGPWTRLEHARACELIQLFVNADGSVNSNTVQTSMTLPALVAAGVPKTDERIQRGIAWLRSRRVESSEGIWYDVFASDVWSTAFSVRALVASGTPAGDARIVRAVEWLLSRQLEVAQPWPNQRKPDAVKVGGWPFQTGNETMADADDAGIVLSALGVALESPLSPRLPEELAQRVRRSMRRARQWLGSMQNPDGGFSAFVCGLPERPKGTIMQRPLDVSMSDPVGLIKLLWSPPPELGDPSTEDLTGRVLHGLASIGARATDTDARRATDFLRRHQLEDGSFWGRWVCNYLASTSHVLSALIALGEDPNQEFVRRAIRFLLSRQNRDGGFGESVLSYRDPEQRGRGPSTAPLTSIVVTALVDAGQGDSPEVARAVDFLVRAQRPDGTWPNADFVATNIPPDGFYVYDGAARHLPVLALGNFVSRTRARTVPPQESWGRWNSGTLAPARMRVDPTADAVVDALLREGDLSHVNALLRSIFENDDPIPPGLPARARRYFEETGELPPWTDMARVRRAQQLFADHGVQLTFGLFCSSLPQAYAGANGALVLAQTQAMLDRTRQRIMETAQFLFDVLDEGGLEPQGRGIRSAQRVRLMHAGVRRLLRDRPSPAWDEAQLGLPINQEDLAGTLMTFSVVTFDAMKRLGVEATDEEGEDWMHLWSVVGHLLGLERELVPNSLDDARDLMEAIRQRQWMPSAQGSALARALSQMMEEFFTGGVLEGLAPTLIRFLAGDQCADLLALPPSDYLKTIVQVGTATAAHLDVDAREDLLERAFGLATQRAMHAIVGHERKHKRASFRVPKSLTQTVVAGD
jgi:squalene cyclase